MSQTLTAPALHPHLGDPWRLAELLGSPGVLCTGHYRLVSGLHSDRFVRFSRVAEDADALAYVADLLAGVVAKWQPSGIVAPSTAGVSLAVELGRRLGARVYLTDVGDDGRPTGLIGAPPGEVPVLVVNDVITTGEGINAIAAIAQDAGATIVGCCAFLSRGSADVQQLTGMPTAVIATVELAAWPRDECPLCRTSEPEDARDLN